MEWIKFSSKKPDKNNIIYINYQVPNGGKWIDGLCYYVGGDFDDEYIEKNGYWVYTEGLYILKSPPHQPECSKPRRNRVPLVLISFIFIFLFYIVILYVRAQ